MPMLPGLWVIMPIAAADPTWHGLTLQAQVRGGLWVWAWGPVPEEQGGPLGPVRVEP